MDCDLGHWILGRFSLLLVTDAANIISAFINPPELREDADTLYGDQTLKEEDLESERERIIRDHLGIIEATMPDWNNQMLDAYREIFALCVENDWKPVLVTPPYPMVYTECFPKDMLEAFRFRTRELAVESGVPWLDYSQNTEFAENFDYFKNIDHLNLVGAKRFSEIVQEDLEELGLWQE